MRPASGSWPSRRMVVSTSPGTCGSLVDLEGGKARTLGRVRTPRRRLLLASLLVLAAGAAPAARAEDGLITFSQQGKYFGSEIVGVAPGSNALTDLALIPGGVFQGG